MAVACNKAAQVGNSFQVPVNISDEDACVHLPEVAAWSASSDSSEDLVVLVSDVNTSVSLSVRSPPVKTTTNLCDSTVCTTANKCTPANANSNGETVHFISPPDANDDDVFGMGTVCLPVIHNTTNGVTIIMVPSGTVQLNTSNARHLVPPTAVSCALDSGGKATIDLTPASDQRAVFMTSTAALQVACADDCVIANGCYTAAAGAPLTVQLNAAPTDGTAATEGTFGSCGSYTYGQGRVHVLTRMVSAGSIAYNATLGKNPSGDTELSINASGQVALTCTNPPKNHLGLELGLAFGLGLPLLAAAYIVRKRRANELGGSEKPPNEVARVPLLPTDMTHTRPPQKAAEAPVPIYSPPVAAAPRPPPPEEEDEEEEEEDDDILGQQEEDPSRPKFGTAQSAALRANDPNILVGERVRVFDVADGRVGKVVAVNSKFGVSTMHSIMFENGSGQPEVILLKKYDSGKSNKGCNFHVLDPA